MQTFYYDNIVKDATIIPSTENSQFPVGNLKDDRRSKIFRSNTNADNIVFDFGISRDAESVLIVDNGDGLGFTSATIQFNPTNSWATPAYSQALTVDFNNGFASATFPTKFYRYARIVFNSSLSYCEVSKIFIGEKANIGNLSFSYPISYRQNSNTIVQKNRLMQKFFDKINTQKEISGSINTMNKDEVEILLAMLDVCSFDVPIWITFENMPSLVNSTRLSGYYYLKDDPSLSLVAGNYWNVRLDFEEGT